MAEDNQDNRRSVRFIVDNQPYQGGESAAFPEPYAHALVQRGIAKFNAHELKSDGDFKDVIEGKNNPGFKSGLGEGDISALIDKKLDEKLKPILDALDKGSAPKSPLAPAVKK